MSTTTKECCRCGDEVEPLAAGAFSYTPAICPTCANQVAEDVAEGERQEGFRSQRGYMGIRRLWWDLGFDDFHAQADMPVLSECVQYAKGWPQTEGLVLYSKGKGNGKTLLAVNILKTVGDGYFVNCPEMLEAIRRSYDGPPTEVFFRAMRAPLLVIDDLGAHKTTDWVREQLYILLNTRIENLTPTIITTNVKTFTEVFEDRIASRVFGHFRILTLKGGDYRREKA